MNSAFNAFHISDFGPRGIVVRDWEMVRGDVYAVKTYQQSIPLGREDTTLELRHTPEWGRAGDRSACTSLFAGRTLANTMKNRWLLNGLGAAFCIALVATSLRQDTHAAGPERPFNAYAPFIARDEAVAAPSDEPAPVATAVGVPTGTATSATIGAAGGNVSTLDSKLVLTIPAGALAAGTVISIQPLTNMAPGRIGGAYRLTPNGQTFLKPITLTFAYTDEDLVGTSADFVGAAFQTADGYWQWAGDATVDTTAKTATVSSSHFSDWSNVRGLQIRPAHKSVRVKGNVGLQVKVCYVDTSGSDEPAFLDPDCDTDQGIVATLSVNEWSVNGVLGGGGVTGTVSGSGPEATYTAPATKPNPNTVDVSARVTDILQPRGINNVLLVSKITITEDSWTGTASGVKRPITTTAQVTWNLIGTVDNVGVYTPTGIVSATFGPVGGCSFRLDPSSHILDSDTDGLLTIDFNTTPPTYHGAGVSIWPATVIPVSGPCEDEQAVYGGGPFFGGSGGPLRTEAVGVVSPDGVTIEGSATDTQSPPATFHWKFTRDQ